MGAQLRVYRRRIRSVQSTKKITRAMELIAASRIVKAQQAVAAAQPYAKQLTRVLSALASQTATIDHPLLQEQSDEKRAAVLVITSDRGLAGGYNANALKAAAQLERGAVLVELLKQGQYSPFPVERQVVSIWAGTNGHLDDVPVNDIRRFEGEFLDFVARSHGNVFDAIVQTGKLGDDVISELETSIKEFKQQFRTGEGGSLVNEAPEEAMDEEDRGQETIKKYKKA